MRLVFVSGILKMFSGVFGAVAVQFVVEYLLYISVHGDDVGHAGDEAAQRHIGVDGPADLGADGGLISHGHVYFSHVDAAQDAQLAFGALYDGLYVILGNDALPHINTQVHHVLGYLVADAVGMVLYQHTTGLYVAVEFGVLGFYNLAPGVRVHKQAAFVAPVVVGVDDVGLYVVDDMTDA